MSGKHDKPMTAARSAWIADGCLVAALLLALTLSWQGSPPLRQDHGLQHAAHQAISRQLGAQAASRVASGATLLAQKSNNAPGTSAQPF